jgi:hypothetical protein
MDSCELAWRNTAPKYCASNLTATTTNSSRLEDFSDFMSISAACFVIRCDDQLIRTYLSRVVEELHFLASRLFQELFAFHSTGATR